MGRVGQSLGRVIEGALGKSLGWAVWCSALRLCLGNSERRKTYFLSLSVPTALAVTGRNRLNPSHSNPHISEHAGKNT